MNNVLNLHQQKCVTKDGGCTNWPQWEEGRRKDGHEAGGCGVGWEGVSDGMGGGKEARRRG